VFLDPLISCTLSAYYLFYPADQVTLDDISNVVIDCVPYSVSSSNRSVYVIPHEESCYL